MYEIAVAGVPLNHNPCEVDDADGTGEKEGKDQETEVNEDEQVCYGSTEDSCRLAWEYFLPRKKRSLIQKKQQQILKLRTISIRSLTFLRWLLAKFFVKRLEFGNVVPLVIFSHT